MGAPTVLVKNTSDIPIDWRFRMPSLNTALKGLPTLGEMRCYPAIKSDLALLVTDDPIEVKTWLKDNKLKPKLYARFEWFSFVYQTRKRYLGLLLDFANEIDLIHAKLRF